MKYAQFIHSHKLYELIPMKVNKSGSMSFSVLPDEGFDWRWQDLTGQGHCFWIKCLPKGETPPANKWGGRSHAKHRIFATCKCGKDIPFGRLGQHRKACEALKWYTEVKDMAGQTSPYLSDYEYGMDTGEK